MELTSRASRRVGNQATGGATPPRVNANASEAGWLGGGEARVPGDEREILAETLLATARALVTAAERLRGL